MDKMGVRSGQRDGLLAIFGAMATARSNVVFEQQCALLEQADVPAATEYFKKNWLPITHQWVSCMKARKFTIGETTNNRLESFNAKVKSVCSKYASLDTFFKEFLAVLRVLRDERVHTSAVASISHAITAPGNVTEDDLQYKELLTPYAYEKLLKQIGRRESIKLPDDVETPVSSREGPLSVTSVACNCGFRSSFRLPCRQILARRKMEGLLSFDSLLVDRRWTSAYSPDPRPTPPASTMQVRETPAPALVTVLTSHQKYRQLMTVASEIAGHGSELGMREFRVCLQAMKDMRDTWCAATSMPTTRSVSTTRPVATEPRRVEEDESEPRRVEEDESEPRRVEEDESELRRVEEDESEPRRVEEDESEPRRVEEDESEPRRVEEDESEPRRVEEDESEPRRVEEDESEPRRVKEDESEPRRVEEDESEPRRVEEDESEPRRVEEEESEPRRVEEDESEPRRVEEDESEPRRVEEDESEPRRVEEDESEPRLG